MIQQEKESIARNAASVWCRCYKCDRIIAESGDECVKPARACLKWWDGYKTTLIALETLERKKLI